MERKWYTGNWFLENMAVALGAHKYNIWTSERLPESDQAILETTTHQRGREIITGNVAAWAVDRMSEAPDLRTAAQAKEDLLDIARMIDDPDLRIATMERVVREYDANVKRFG